jgi:hypothetical protein
LKTCKLFLINVLVILGGSNEYVNMKVSNVMMVRQALVKHAEQITAAWLDGNMTPGFEGSGRWDESFPVSNQRV